MKTTLIIFALLMAALPLGAQTNGTIRLAVIAETGEASQAADLLTAQLSGLDKIQLLERDEIQRVYREQALAKTSQDEMKLGRILGADGLLLLNAIEKRGPTLAFASGPPAIDLTARLIAVKPGVILFSEKFTLVPSDLADWYSSLGRHLEIFLPKLTVLEKDAIPISIINLRSAIQSDEGKATERQLKTLIIQRLSQEQRLFVLERQRMELLATEKDLKSDPSPFWNGSYLLEGVLDQNGYSKDRITLNARLTPPKGGAPAAFEVSGPRTNPAGLVNQLAEKINEFLKIQSTVKSWNASDEARQYLEEAKWALRWEVYAEAQAAAESAWALGDKNLECALVRTKSYVLEIPAVVPPGVEHYTHFWKRANEVHINERPDPKYCEVALYALQCYDEFSRTSPDGEPKILSRGKGWSDWHDSDWYRMGVEAVNAASGVLEHFNHFPELQKRVADPLADLRSLTRSVAELIAKAPSVHDSYFVGNRIVSRDELSHTMDEQPNIFRAEVDLGCYWQETPEDTLAMYRQLMSSPVFAYLHQDLWIRPPERPRLIAWNEEDKRSIPIVWAKFIRELANSSDVNLQLESEAFVLADAKTDQKMAVAFTNFFDHLIASRDTLLSNHVEVVYLDWRAGALVPGDGIVTPTKTALEELYHSKYWPQLEAIDQDYWRTSVPAAQNSPASQENIEQFDKQKQYLKANTLFAPQAFVQLFLFGFKNYSKAQALELQPLLAAYKASLEEQIKQNNPWARNGLMLMQDVENNVKNCLNPVAKAAPIASRPPIAAQTPSVRKSHARASPPATEEVIANVLTVSTFLPIPWDNLGTNPIVSLTIHTHQWVENKLVLDFSYNALIYKFGTNGNWTEMRTANYPSVAILDPITKHWDVAVGPEEGLIARNHYYHRSTLWHGELYTSDGVAIKKYDFGAKKWNKLDISDGNAYQLFNINEHLYAANESTVFEITEDAQHTRLMASTRRQPAVSVLDTEDLGLPALFEGPGHSLRLATSHKIFTWNGTDWREDFETPATVMSPAIFADGILYMTEAASEPLRLYHLATEGDTAELYLNDTARHPHFFMTYQPPGPASHGPEAKWKLPANLPFASLARAPRQSDLFLLANHSETQPVYNQKLKAFAGTKVLMKGGCHAEMFCFSGDSPLPQDLYLRFDAPGGRPPVVPDHSAAPGLFMTPPSWMLFADHDVFFGLETVDALFSSSASLMVISNEYKAGVWIMPFSELEPAIAKQKQAQLARKKSEAAAAAKAHQEFLAKFDRNHNGVIDPDEKEEALDDPGFIAAQLELIDTNHNFWLDPAELAYFDANTNKILEPKEQAGIGITQHLLADKLLKKFDDDNDSLLNSMELDRLVTEHYGRGNQSGMWFSWADKNHEGSLDVDELEAFLESRLLDKLHPHRFSPSPRLNFGPRGDSGQSLKSAVESYWRDPEGSTAGEQRFPGRRVFNPSAMPGITPVSPP